MREPREGWYPPWLESIRPAWSLGGKVWRAVVRCWRTQPCLGCGGTYSFTVRRSCRVRGLDERDAVREGASYFYERLISSGEGPVRPCPSCGLCQPGMIGRWKVVRHAAVVLVLGALACGAVAVTWSNHVLWAWWACAGLVLLMGVAHLAVERGHRKGREANLRWVAGLEKQGELRPHQPGRGEQDHRSASAVNRWRWAGPFALAGLALAPFLVLPAEALRLARGWPTNQEIWPVVIGPSDRVKLTLANEGEACVKGLWSGKAEVELLNEAELGLAGATFAAETAQTTWGSFIAFKDTERAEHPDFWVKVRLPDDPRLEGKVVRLRIRLEVTYPEAVGSAFTEKVATRERTVELKVATREAASTYSSLSFGSVLGVALGFVCGLALLLVADRERALGPSGRGRPFRADGPGRDDDPVWREQWGRPGGGAGRTWHREDDS